VLIPGADHNNVELLAGGRLMDEIRGFLGQICQSPRPTARPGPESAAVAPHA
jgi:hypothetical protein